MTKDVIEVTYIYKMKTAKVIVQYLEKDNTPEDDRDNKVLAEEEIIEELKKDGIETHYAQIVIENVRDDKDDLKSFRNSLIMGGFYIGGGLLLNFFSYNFATAANSVFFYFFWGIIVLGLVTIIRGFILYK